MAFPIGVVVHGVVDDAEDSLWALVFLVPFVVDLVPAITAAGA